jgi:hypothetical protein
MAGDWNTFEYWGPVPSRRCANAGDFIGTWTNVGQQKIAMCYTSEAGVVGAVSFPDSAPKQIFTEGTPNWLEDTVELEVFQYIDVWAESAMMSWNRFDNTWAISIILPEGGHDYSSLQTRRSIYASRADCLVPDWTGGDIPAGVWESEVDSFEMCGTGVGLDEFGSVMFGSSSRISQWAGTTYSYGRQYLVQTGPEQLTSILWTDVLAPGDIADAGRLEFILDYALTSANSTCPPDGWFRVSGAGIAELYAAFCAAPSGVEFTFGLYYIGGMASSDVPVGIGFGAWNKTAYDGTFVSGLYGAMPISLARTVDGYTATLVNATGETELWTLTSVDPIDADGTEVTATKCLWFDRSRSAWGQWSYGTLEAGNHAQLTLCDDGSGGEWYDIAFA